MPTPPTLKTTKTLQARLLSGSFILLSGSGLASVLSLVYNVAVARFLGPAGYGDAAAVYTILILLSALTLSFQIVSSKIVAQQKSTDGKYAGYRIFHQWAWGCGVVAALVLLIFEQPISHSLQLSSSALVPLLAIGVAFYIPVGARRGYLLGAYGFRRLAANLVLEGAVRLFGSILLILMGFGVAGVIAANSAAVVIVYFAILPRHTKRLPSPILAGHALREMSQAIVFFSGQALIYNFHIVLVKHLFLPKEAGLYAAIAMVGRVVFSFSQAIVNSMFPLVAGTEEKERKDLRVIGTSLVLVFGIGFLFALVLRFMPNPVWAAFFGSRFEMIAGGHGLSYLMALYAITTVVYSLSSVIITYEMSYKIANTSWIQLVFSFVVIGGIWAFHSSLLEVILVQLILMCALFLLVAFPFLINSVKGSFHQQLGRTGRPVRVIRRVSEDEVIAEFLKSDFHKPDFQPYQKVLGGIVVYPNLSDPEENAKRRALFSLRYLALWGELPTNTQWYELDIDEEEIGQVRVFPRAQWQNFARGRFSFTEIVEGIRSGQNLIDSRFLTKINEIREQLLEDGDALGSVILIGVDRTDPLTIIDGNHRLVAAMLTSPSRLHNLRFLCGFSPKMMECCWYNTSFTTLLRYAKHVLVHSVRRPKKELARLLRVSG